MDLNRKTDWTEFYPDAEENQPLNRPTPKGKTIAITTFVDADHARDKVTRRSVTGIVIFLNNTPINWTSKRQKTVKSSTYGSEMVASRIAVEGIISLRYFLAMIGVGLEKSSLLIGDNMAVVLNTTLPSSTLKKKYQSCNYHKVRQNIAG